MRSSAIHREREREREKEVKKCQNSRSFEHLPFLKEGINTFDQKTSLCCIVVSPLDDLVVKEGRKCSARDRSIS